MDSYINKAMVENEKELTSGKFGGKFGGAKPPVAKTDSKVLQKVLNFERRAVRDMETGIKLLGIKEGANRYKFEKKFSEFVNQLNAVVEDYLSGSLENQTGAVLRYYNDLVLYLKNVLNYKNLSETEKENIKTEFNNIIPQITQVLDIAINENYLDKKYIKTLYNNIVNQNYVQIKTPSYKQEIELKKPIYLEAEYYDNQITDLIADVYDKIENGIYINSQNNMDNLQELLRLEEEMTERTSELITDLNPNQIKSIRIAIKKLLKEAMDLKFEKTSRGKYIEKSSKEKEVKAKEKEVRSKEKEVKAKEKGKVEKSVISKEFAESSYGKSLLKKKEESEQTKQMKYLQSVATPMEINDYIKAKSPAMKRSILQDVMDRVERERSTINPITVSPKKKKERAISAPVEERPLTMKEAREARMDSILGIERARVPVEEEKGEEERAEEARAERIKRILERERARTGQGKKINVKKLKSKDLFELFKKIQVKSKREPIRGKGKVTTKELGIPSQSIYNKLNQENMDKIYGYGSYVANATRKKMIPKYNMSNFEEVPMPTQFIDHFGKVEKLSKKQ